MNVQIIYSSLTGCTRRLAEGIYEGLRTENKSIHDLKDGTPELTGDVILLGFWVDRGGPCPAMKTFMESISGKMLGVFSTLGYWPESGHGHGTIVNASEILAKNNTIIGGYVCNGAISEAIKERFRRNPTGGSHSATPENELRWELLKDHPTEAEIALATERFGERLELLEGYRKENLEFKSIEF